MKGHTLELLLVLAWMDQAESRCQGDLKPLFKWGPGEVSYSGPGLCEATLKERRRLGQYIPVNNLPLGVNLHPYKPALIVTCPRWKPGVLSTLNLVPLGTGNLKEPLQPYPNFAMNDIYGNNSSTVKLYSIIRTAVDPCGRLWAVDNGNDDHCGRDRQLAPARLLIFDLRTSTLVHTHEIRDVCCQPKSSFGKIVVDVTSDDCDEAFAYFTDVRCAGLIIYDLKRDRSYRIRDKSFELEPQYDHYYMTGNRYKAGNQLDGICLSGLYKDGYRNLYANTATSNKQYITSTKLLRDEALARRGGIFYYLGERCATCHTGGSQVIDELTGVMFYSELNNNAIGCWDGDHDNFGGQSQDRVAVDNVWLKFASDMDMVRAYRQGCVRRTLIVLSCDLREFFHSVNGVTANIQYGDVDDLLKGTICQPKKPFCSVNK